MKKILLSLLTVGLLVGCSSKSEEKDILSDDKQPTSNNTDTQNVKLPTLFEVEKSKKYQLGLDDYYIYEFKNMGFNYTEGSFTFLNFNDKNDNEIGVRILCTKYLKNKQQKAKDIYDISSEGSQLLLARDVKLTSIENEFTKLDYQNNQIATNINGKEALLKKGVATEINDREKSLFFAMFDFFLDDEKNYPCEVILTSSDGVSPDDLEAMARELIGTIQSK